MRKKHCIIVLVKYDPEGAIARTRPTMSINIKGKTINDIPQTILSVLRTCNHIVDISDKKKAEIKLWAESTFGDVLNHIHSFQKKYGRPEAPFMLKDDFFSSLRIFRNSEKFETTRSPNSDAWNAFYKGFYSRYSILKEEITVDDSEKLFKELRFGIPIMKK